MSDKKHGITKSYWHGAMVGMAQAIVFHPIDLIRIRYFLKKQELGHPRTWFNGMLFNIKSTAIKQMAVFPTQELLKERCGGSDVWSGLAAGALLGSIACPINAIKTPQQASKTQRGSFLVAKHIYDRNGLMGFYRGGLGIFLRDFTWAGVYFPLYSWLDSNIFNSIQDRHLKKVGSSISAASIAMIAAYPFDGSRLYRQHHYGEKNYHFWHGFKKSFELTPSNFKSFTTGMIRVPLATTFCHMLYLYLQREF